MDLDHFLTQMREQGADDSEGVFTVAVDKAAWKLAEFRLADSSHYPVHVIACAVANGATGVAIRRSKPDAGGHMLTFGFDGPGFSLEDLEQLQNQGLLGNAHHPRLRELAVALNVAGALGQVRFLSYSEEEALELKILARQVSVERIPPGEHQAQLLSVTSLGLMDLEPSLEKCRYAPLRITLDGVRRDEPVDLGYHDPNFFGLYHVEGKDPLPVASLTGIPKRFFQHSLSHDRARSLVLGLSWPLTAEVKGFQGHALGVCRPLDPELLGSAHLFGVVSTPDLTRDLSEEGFTRNRAYETFAEELASYVDDFWVAFCSRPTQDLDANLLRALAHELVDRFQGRETPPEVAKFLAHAQVAEYRTPAETDPEELQTIGRRARQSSYWEPFKEAQTLLRSRAAEARRQRALGEMVDWLRTERPLLEGAETGLDEWLETFLCALAVYPAGAQRGDPKLKAWAVPVLDGERPGHPLRALLALVPELSQDQAWARLSTHNGHSAWTALIEYLLELPSQEATGEEYLDLALELLRALDRGHTEQAMGTLARLASTPEGERTYGYWLETLWALYKGRLPLGSWAWLRAQTSIYWAFRAPDKLKHKRKRFRQLAVPGDGTTHTAFLTQSAFQPELLPMLVLRAVSYRRHGGPASGLQFLCRTLLQLTFGPLDRPLTAETEPPTTPFSARVAHH